MNKNLLVKSEIRNGQKIEVYHDTDAESPCTNWDMGCCYLFEYSDTKRLHDDCSWRDAFGKYGDSHISLEEALRKLVVGYVEQDDIRKYIKAGNVDNMRMRYDRSEREWKLEQYYDGTYYKGWSEIFSCTPDDWKRYDYTEELVENLEYDEMFDLLDKYGKDIVVKETSTTGYCQGDYCKILCFCTKERFDKYIGDNGTPWKEHALSLMDGDTEDIGRWMWGDVLGYVLYDLTEDVFEEGDSRDLDDESNWEETDSCWGYFMDADDLIDEILGKEEKVA